MCKINNNETCDERDWRIRWQEDYLMNARLQYKQYKKHSERWEHEHCNFCWTTFSEQPEYQHYGYCTEDEKYWICEKCFNDFSYMFNWSIVNSL